MNGKEHVCSPQNCSIICAADLKICLTIHQGRPVGPLLVITSAVRISCSFYLM